MQGQLFCATEYLTHFAASHHDDKKGVVYETESARVAINDIATVPRKYARDEAQVPQEVEGELDEKEPLLRLRPSQSSAIDYNDPSYHDPASFKFLPDSNLGRLGMVGEDVIPCPYGEAGDVYINLQKFRESARMALLKIRELKPHLFIEPLPLVEVEILHSALYRNILAGKEGSAISDEYPPGEALSIRDPRNHIDIQQDQLDSSVDESALEANLEQKNARLFDFLRRVRDSHTAVSRRARRKVFTTGIAVRETDYLPPPAEDGEVAILPPRKRALKPIPATRTPLTAQIKKCDVLVQVVSARNIPQRVSEKEIAEAVRSSSPKKRSSAEKAAEEKNDGPTNPVVAEDPIIDPLMLKEEVIANRSGVKSFVELRLQENCLGTTPTEGLSPIWRQSLTLDFRTPGGDLSMKKIFLINDDLILTLFDEVIEDDAHRGGFLEGESTLRTEKRYLGAMSIPLRTVLSEGRIEGCFRVDAPLLNFGYTPRYQPSYFNRQRDRGMFLRQGDQAAQAENLLAVNRKSIWSSYALPAFMRDILTSPAPVPDSNLDSDEFLSESVLKEFGSFACSNAATYLSVMVTLDPRLPPKPALRSVDLLPPAAYIAKAPDGNGNEFALLSHARRWLTGLAAIGPHTMRRKYVIFATDHNGHSVFIPRYLTGAIKRPEGFSSRKSLLHLVSQLPFIPDAQAFIGETDLWCTVKQTLEIGAGDEEEHAVLLYNLLASHLASHNLSMTEAQTTNYPNDEALKKEALFLVLGSALPEGETVYLLLRDTSKPDSGGSASNFLVINPCNGNIYSAADPSCPLKKIISLVTPYNIFANIQLSDAPCHMDFNILNSNNWRPFFGKRFPFPEHGLFGIQSDIDYFPTSTAYCLEIETALKNAVKSNLRKWRSKRKRSITTFHPDASASMYDALEVMEHWRRNGTCTITIQISHVIFNQETEIRMSTVSKDRCDRNYDPYYAPDP